MKLFRGKPDVQKLKAKRDVRGLIKALGYQSDWSIRKQAAKVLGEIGDSRAVEPLIAALEDSTGSVVFDAAIALGQIGDLRAIEPLIVALEKWPEGYVTCAPADALVKIGAQAVEPLISTLGYVSNDVVRKAAAQALGEIGDPRAAEPLIGKLDDWVEDVRKAAARSLDQLRWQPDKSEGAAFYEIAWRQWERCAEIGAPAVKPLIRALRWTRGRREVVEALVKIGSPAVEQLITLLRDVSSTLLDEAAKYRLHAAEMLGRIGDPRAIEPLVSCLKDENQEVRKAAFETLRKLGWKHDKIEDEVLFLLEVNDLKQCAELGASAVEPLIDCLATGSTPEKIFSTEVLTKIRDVRAVEPLIAALSDEEGDVREASATALGWIGDTRAVGALIDALQDYAASVRKCAAYALAKIRDLRALEPLLETLNDGEEDVRIGVISALGKIGDLRAVQPLIDMLSRTTRDNRWQVALALGEIGSAVAAEPMLNLATTDPRSANWAVGALERIMEKDVAGVSEPVLEKIAAMKDWVLGPMETYYPETRGTHERYDCSRIKQLAREESIRRGLDA
jgi:HEAT repeat protein